MSAKRGRPFKKVSDVQVTRLAKIGCTLEEMSYILGVSEDTIERNYADAYKKGAGEIRKSLRRKQIELALKGNPTMLIWLGKQMLGQKDLQRQEHTGAEGKPIEIQNIDYRALLAPLAPATMEHQPASSENKGSGNGQTLGKNGHGKLH